MFQREKVKQNCSLKLPLIKTIINTFLFETKFMIWKCRNYKKYENSEVFD